MMYEVPVIHPTVEQAGSLIGEATELSSRYFDSWEAHDDGLSMLDIEFGGGWLLDVALHPRFEDNGWVYLYHGHPKEGTKYP